VKRALTAQSSREKKKKKNHEGQKENQEKANFWRKGNWLGKRTEKKENVGKGKTNKQDTLKTRKQVRNTRGTDKEMSGLPKKGRGMTSTEGRKVTWMCHQKTNKNKTTKEGRVDNWSQIEGVWQKKRDLPLGKEGRGTACIRRQSKRSYDPGAKKKVGCLGCS